MTSPLDSARLLGGFLAWLRRGTGASAVPTLGHPRHDRLWLEGSAEGPRLVWHHERPTRRVFRLTPQALQDLQVLLDVPAHVLTRLASVKAGEDLRVLNLLLWARGDEDSSALQLQMTDHDVRRIGSPQLDALTAEGLRHHLEPRAGEQGRLEVVRWDGDDDGWQLVLAPKRTDGDWVLPALEPGREGDRWRPACWMHEPRHRQGAGRLTLQWGAVRSWGRHWVPLAPPEKFSHRGQQMQEIWPRLDSWTTAPHPLPRETLAPLLDIRLGDPVTWVTHLEGWGEPLRQAVLAQGVRPGQSAYRLLTAAARTAYTAAGLRRRAVLLHGLLPWLERVGRLPTRTPRPSP